MDSIFEKLRWQIRRLPGFFLPYGFNDKRDLSYMKILNCETGSAITGEAGDNIGRGGRNLVYFKDESCWYERAENIEAALLDNATTQIDISSVHGTDTVFYRRRMAGQEWEGEIVDPTRTQVFLLDWRDHPLKTPEWYSGRRAHAEADGLLAQFAQEIDRDYSASVAGTVIRPEWVQAALGLAEDLGLDTSGKKVAGLDVADDGLLGDKNALAIVHGLEVVAVHVWGGVDVGVTAARAYNLAVEAGAAEIQYDCIGVGAGARAQFNQIEAGGRRDLRIVPWAGSGAVVDGYELVDRPAPGASHSGPINRDFFANLKAQAWWSVRRRLYNAWRARQGEAYDPQDILSISRSLPADQQRVLLTELCQPIRKETPAGKTRIDKSPNSARSPNAADALIMAAFPLAGGWTETIGLGERG